MEAGPDFPTAYAGPQHSPGFVFWRDFMRWQRGLNVELQPLGLTQPQFAVLAVCGWMLRQGEGLSQHQLVESLGLDRMHVSQIASRLEGAGLIRRSMGEADMRTKSIALTSEGQARLAAALPVVEAYDRRFFAAK